MTSDAPIFEAPALAPNSDWSHYRTGRLFGDSVTVGALAEGERFATIGIYSGAVTLQLSLTRQQALALAGELRTAALSRDEKEGAL
jgi:hypothetical protein